MLCFSPHKLHRVLGESNIFELFLLVEVHYKLVIFPLHGTCKSFDFSINDAILAGPYRYRIEALVGKLHHLFCCHPKWIGITHRPDAAINLSIGDELTGGIKDLVVNVIRVQLLIGATE